MLKWIYAESRISHKESANRPLMPNPLVQLVFVVVVVVFVVGFVDFFTNSEVLSFYFPALSVFDYYKWPASSIYRLQDRKGGIRHHHQSLHVLKYFLTISDILKYNVFLVACCGADNNFSKQFLPLSLLPTERSLVPSFFQHQARVKNRKIWSSSCVAGSERPDSFCGISVLWKGWSFLWKGTWWLCLSQFFRPVCHLSFHLTCAS